MSQQIPRPLRVLLVFLWLQSSSIATGCWMLDAGCRPDRPRSIAFCPQITQMNADGHRRPMLRGGSGGWAANPKFNSGGWVDRPSSPQVLTPSGFQALKPSSPQALKPIVWLGGRFGSTLDHSDGAEARYLLRDAGTGNRFDDGIDILVGGGRLFREAGHRPGSDPDSALFELPPQLAAVD